VTAVISLPSSRQEQFADLLSDTETTADLVSGSERDYFLHLAAPLSEVVDALDRRLVSLHDGCESAQAYLDDYLLRHPEAPEILHLALAALNKVL
jgi:hypothetical protein